ncbi:MAG TPA: hypothetical protein PLG66_05455, partial [Calditrichia bacterium]|nr:hypothetical protein [Calditrichia bacterium]
RREWAYCKKCLKTYPGYFVGCIQILDRDLKDRKKDLARILKNVEYQLQPRLEFEKVLQEVEKEEIYLIFANTTRLAMEIIKAIREEWGGQTQYEWIDKNRFLRVTWIAKREDRNYFTPRQKAIRERGIGRFSFEFK